MKIFIIRIISFVLCTIVIGYFLSKLAGSVPIVYWSVSKDECVKVVVSDWNDCFGINKRILIFLN